MSAPYYTGDRVPLKFTISDADGDVNPTACVVTILKPNNGTAKCTAAIGGNMVSCNVSGSVNSERGTYRVYFVNTLPSGGERTHKIEYEIIDNPEGWPK